MTPQKHLTGVKAITQAIDSRGCNDILRIFAHDKQHERGRQ